MTKYLLQALTVGSVGLSMVSCNHKDLITDDTFTGDLQIEFDWRNAPEAKPASMIAYLFDSEGNSEPLRYNFAGRDGGEARVPAGTYSGIGFNSDGNDWARFRNTDRRETFEIYTDDASRLTTFGLDTRSVPRAPQAETERVAIAPQQIWNDSREGFKVLPYVEGQKLTFYPEEVTCHYTVTVKDVTGINYLKGGSLDATVSGLSESYFTGRKETSTVPVTLPLTLSEDGKPNELFGQFLTFGDTADKARKHILTIYLVYEDNTGSYATYDVTDQVLNAPDPHHVDIVVSGLDLPQPISSGGGFVPNVNEWQGVEYDLNM